MKNKENKLINFQKKTKNTLLLTIVFFIGFLTAIWQTWVLAREDVLTRVFPAIQAIVLVLLLILVIILINYIKIGKAMSPTSNNKIEQIEKLGKLKNEGLISEVEFEKEKNKILNN